MSIKDTLLSLKGKVVKNKAKIGAIIASGLLVGAGIGANSNINDKYNSLQEANASIVEAQRQNADELARLNELYQQSSKSNEVASLEEEVKKLQEVIKSQENTFNQIQNNKTQLDKATQEKMDNMVAVLNELNSAESIDQDAIDKVLTEIAKLGKAAETTEEKSEYKKIIEIERFVNCIETELVNLETALEIHIRTDKEVSHEEMFDLLQKMETQVVKAAKQGYLKADKYKEITTKISDLLDRVFVCKSVDAANGAYNNLRENGWSCQNGWYSESGSFREDAYSSTTSFFNGKDYVSAYMVKDGNSEDVHVVVETYEETFSSGSALVGMPIGSGPGSTTYELKKIERFDYNLKDGATNYELKKVENGATLVMPINTRVLSYEEHLENFKEANVSDRGYDSLSDNWVVVTKDGKQTFSTDENGAMLECTSEDKRGNTIKTMSFGKEDTQEMIKSLEELIKEAKENTKNNENLR